MTVMFAASWVAAIVNGCSATPMKVFTTGSGGMDSSSSSSGTGGMAHTTSVASSSSGGIGGINFQPDAGDASDAVEELITNPCGSKCGPVELCDPAHIGLDDNCNGQVDEGCPCTAGAVHWCFKGDPSYHNAPGCFDGVETCNEQGKWGACVGGVHATDGCFLNDTTACHAITSPPYVDVHLKTGTGNFSANAVPGSESYTVVCPTGVSQCPTVTVPDDYKPIQSGEYLVTYTRVKTGDTTPVSCTFPLFVGARGLRVELSWEHTTADTGVDLDLHVHQPVNTGPWGISPGAPQDCTWSNCQFTDLEPPQSFSSPHWFPDTNMPPQPVNWDVDPTPLNNTCYSDPRGVGMQWQTLAMGCHNPRSDIDNIQCDYAITNSNDSQFCAPENINVDYPPNKQWFRVGVHYYYNHGRTYDVHPAIKIFCNGALSADLGPNGGFYVPSSPVAFEPSDGAGTGQGNRFWIVADVAFTTDSCGNAGCTVLPVYSDPVNKTPFLTLDTAATTTFAPAWPAPPP